MTIRLQLDNVELIEPETIRFDFLGKDSIRYENEVKVERKVFELVKEFKTKDANGTSECNLLQSDEASILYPSDANPIAVYGWAQERMVEA